MACMAVMLFGTVSAATPEKFADNSVLTSQQHPAASGSTVVWSDKRNGLYQIYEKNLASSSKAKVVSSGPGNQYAPDIYGSKVVWADTRNSGLSQIYVKDLSSSSGAKIILSTATDQFAPRIYGNNVVWQQQITPSKATVVDYNLATNTFQYAPTTTATKVNPDIYKNNVVYSQYNSGTGVNDIKMWDTIGNTVQTIAASKGILGNLASTFTVPRIYGDHVVYQGYGGGNIFMHTPSYYYVNNYQISKSTTTSLGGSSAHGAYNPAIQGSFAVWQVQTSSNNFDIMMKDLSKNNAVIKVTTNQYNQVLPTVGASSSGIYVSYQDYRTGTSHPSIVWRNNDTLRTYHSVISSSKWPTRFFSFQNTNNNFQQNHSSRFSIQIYQCAKLIHKQKSQYYHFNQK